MEDIIICAIRAAFFSLQNEKSWASDIELPETFELNTPQIKAYGDYSSNVIVQSCRRAQLKRGFDFKADSNEKYDAKRCADLMAEKLSNELTQSGPEGKPIHVESRSKGFLNFFLHPRTDETQQLHKGDKNQEALKVMLKPIGVIHSCFSDRYGTPRQGVMTNTSRAVIELGKEFSESWLEGLEKFSHCWVIFLFDQNKNDMIKAKVNPPKLMADAVGVFSTRAPYRPCPIGLTPARIRKIEGTRIFLSGVDVIDGTPLLDIKPYMKLDIIHDATTPDLPFHKVEITVTYADSLFEKFSEYVETFQFGEPNKTGGSGPFRFYGCKSEFLETVEACIKIDPRNMQQIRQEHGGIYQIMIDNFEVSYKFTSETSVVVTGMDYTRC